MGCPPIMSQDTQDTWKFWGKTSSRFDPGVNLLIIGQLNPKRPKQEHIYIIHYISPCLCFCSILILILVGGLEHIYIIYINSIWPTNGMLFFSTNWLNHQPVILFHIMTPWFPGVPGPGFPNSPGPAWLVALGRPRWTFEALDGRAARHRLRSRGDLVIGTHMYWSFIGDITHGIMLHL